MPNKEKGICSYACSLTNRVNTPPILVNNRINDGGNTADVERSGTPNKVRSLAQEKIIHRKSLKLLSNMYIAIGEQLIGKNPRKMDITHEECDYWCWDMIGGGWYCCGGRDLPPAEFAPGDYTPFRLENLIGDLENINNALKWLIEQGEKLDVKYNEWLKSWSKR